MKTVIALLALFALAFALTLLLMGNYEATDMPENFPPPDPAPAPPTDATTDTETATFGGGCFWCTEAVFLQLRGVKSVTSGYTGGHLPNPTYDDICDGDTGHAEVVQIVFDPKVITFSELLEVHWRTHDPTTLNRQGNDRGPQYRSAVFYHSEQQRDLAERYKAKIDATAVYAKPLVTEITKASTFYPAEAYHQNYYANNKGDGYCRVMIGPKVEKLKKVFADKLKSE
jgi:peptide-methionine (S)-S-oxide reductase